MKKKPEPTRENIIEFLKKNGGLVSAACEFFQIPEVKVRNSVRGTDVKIITLAEEKRKESQLAIVNAFNSGKTTVESMAKEFPGKPITTINSVLVQNGLPRLTAEKKTSKGTPFAILFHFMKGVSQSEIAEKFSVSKQYVNQIITTAKEEGFSEFFPKKQK